MIRQVNMKQIQILRIRVENKQVVSLTMSTLLTHLIIILCLSFINGVMVDLFDKGKKIILLLKGIYIILVVSVYNKTSNDTFHPVATPHFIYNHKFISFSKWWSLHLRRSPATLHLRCFKVKSFCVQSFC